MIVWGGDADAGDTSVLPVNTGGRYTPSTDAWIPTSTGGNTPSARASHSAVWTGVEMIVWGGAYFGSYMNTGGRYTPSVDAWIPTSTGANTPSTRTFHTAVWTGTEMMVWGGGPANGNVNTGGRYDPITDGVGGDFYGRRRPDPTLGCHGSLDRG
jgi:hypothetical protein